MPSIVNGLFSGRSGIASHGVAIAAVGDNISNSSTVGYKTSRTEFEDLVAGGQAAGKIIGSGSSVSAVTQVFEQGTLEFTSRPLDLAIDGNGYFVVADGEQRFYTRAGNFKVDASGFVVNQNDLAVLGFPDNGTGALEPLNINTISQDSVATTAVAVSGNVDSRSTVIAPAGIPAATAAGTVPATETVTYADLNAAAEFSTTVDVFDSLGEAHTITFFFYHTQATPTGEYRVYGYVPSEDVDPSGSASGYPRLISGTPASGLVNMQFGGDGTRTNAPALGSFDLTAAIPWANGADTSSIDINLTPFTQFAASSNVLSITQNGQGIGTVTSLSIEKNGDIFALLSNGQSAIIGTVGLVSFSNAEGLTRIGGTLLQQSASSGEPIIGKPSSGTFGAVQSGS